MRAKRRRSEGQIRKLPTTATGQAIFEAILEASRQIIEREGYEGLTSNRIAQEAGVSIGSFYQYFPDRDAVLAEIARSIELRSHEVARERIRRAGNDVVAMIDGIIDILSTTLLGDVQTRTTLLQQIPRGWIHEASAEVDRKVVKLVEGTIREHQDQMGHIGDPAISAFMLVTSVEAVVEACLERHPAWLESGALHEHLRRLVMCYLGLTDEP